MTFENAVVREVVRNLRESMSDTFLEVATSPGSRVYSYGYTLELPGMEAHGRIVRVRFLPALNSEFGRQRKSYPMLPVELGVELYVSAADDQLHPIRLNIRNGLALRQAFFAGVSLTAGFHMIADPLTMHHRYVVNLSLGRALSAHLSMHSQPFTRFEELQSGANFADVWQSFAEAFSTATLHLGWDRSEWERKLQPLFEVQRTPAFIGDRGLEDVPGSPHTQTLILRVLGQEEVTPRPSRRRPVEEPPATTRASRGILGPIRRRIDL